MACGLIIKDANKIMMVKNSNNIWSFPKGSFEKQKDNSKYLCARREFFEETGLVGFTYEYQSEPIIEYTDKGTISCYLFIGRIVNKKDSYGAIKDHRDDEIVESKFLTLDEIEGINLLQRRKDIARRALTEEFNYDSNDMFISEYLKVKIGKNICYLLRHHLDEFKVIRSDAYVPIDELVKKINEDKKMNVNFDEIIHVSTYCPKKRTEIDDTKMMIRCVQGHSSKGINEEELMTEITEPIKNCYHATDKKVVGMIQTNGLNKMSRQHIHFAYDENLLRKGKGIHVEVIMDAAMKAGIKFYRAKNNVILSAGIDGTIPAEFLIIHYRKNDKKK